MQRKSDSEAFTLETRGAMRVSKKRSWSEPPRGSAASTSGTFAPHSINPLPGGVMGGDANNRSGAFQGITSPTRRIRCSHEGSLFD